MNEVKELLNAIESFGWTVEEKGTNEYSLTKFDAAYGYELCINIEAKDGQEVFDSLRDVENNFDVSQEAYDLLDDTGHGKDGAPYEMIDVLREMYALKREVHNLYIDLANWYEQKYAETRRHNMVDLKGKTDFFTEKDIVEGGEHDDYEGKILVFSELSMKDFKEPFRKAEYQLFYAHGGFGCSPIAIGSAVFGYFLTDGEECRQRRGDFLGVLRHELVAYYGLDAVVAKHEHNKDKVINEF